MSNEFTKEAVIQPTNKKVSAMAIISLVLGIIGMLTSCMCFGIIAAIPGFILGLIAIIMKKKPFVSSLLGLISSCIGIIIFTVLSIFVVSTIEPADSQGQSQNTINEAVSGNDIENYAVESQPVTTAPPVPTPTPTATPTPTPTPEPTPEPTPTPSAEEIKQTFIESCNEYSYKTLARNPDDYIGERIVLTVKVEQILQGGLFDSNEYYRVYTNDEYDWWMGDEYFMYDYRVDDDMRILENDILKIYGEFAGLEGVVRAFSQTTEYVPAVKVYYLELLEE